MCDDSRKWFTGDYHPPAFELGDEKNTGAANAVIDTYPRITTWILAGQSQGGASSATFAEINQNKIDFLALWDSHPPNNGNLSANSIFVISIFGTTNNIPSTDNFNNRKHLLPADTRFVGIEVQTMHNLVVMDFKRVMFYLNKVD